MNTCSSCKNPITSNSIECEWCGAVLTNSYKDHVLILLDGGRQKLALVKLIMDLIGTSLSESKKIVDSKNSVVLTTKDLKKAEIIKYQLENCGASIEIK